MHNINDCARVGIFNSSVSSPPRRRVSAYDNDSGNLDGDIDSVVFGSTGGHGEGFRDSGASLTGAGRGVEKETGKTFRESVGDGEGPRGEPLQVREGDEELYFDPILNCYYDRATDKYYGLS